LSARRETCPAKASLVGAEGNLPGQSLSLHIGQIAQRLARCVNDHIPRQGIDHPVGVDGTKPVVVERLIEGNNIGCDDAIAAVDESGSRVRPGGLRDGKSLRRKDRREGGKRDGNAGHRMTSRFEPGRRPFDRTHGTEGGGDGRDRIGRHPPQESDGKRGVHRGREKGHRIGKGMDESIARMALCGEQATVKHATRDEGHRIAEADQKRPPQTRKHTAR
jgi:hypothetical protein